MAGKAKSEKLPAPLSLRERNRLRTRRELLDAALEVFAESGYGLATVENIAARAGASKVTLYTYFPQGREELFRELYDEVNQEMIEKVSAIYDEDGDHRARILAVTEALMEIGQRPLIGRLYSIDDPALDVALNPVRGHASRVCADLMASDLAAARKSGAVKTKASTMAIAELLVGAMRTALSDVVQEQVAPADMLAAMDALVSDL
ncbi:TetR/AcrR family transcriptional regulator [Streptomyces chartreusis]|uniref:Helix-turn-helix transcriptional regulator n=1 Tax=Streptomyces chartreusis TaxID=1969 RepID=A0A7H8T0Y9_STRCX|nr:TetR/AcrR family transcriptional regulator [Streptomyces chartreusis]QKZ17143.1 helix-turn-helix transcriptional regulator [Streptomyces chartreusis]